MRTKAIELVESKNVPEDARLRREGRQQPAQPPAAVRRLDFARIARADRAQPVGVEDQLVAIGGIRIQDAKAAVTGLAHRIIG